MFEKKKTRFLLLSSYILFNIITIILFALEFFTDIETPLALPMIILVTWAIAIGFLYCYKVTNFPTLKSTTVLFYNSITNILLYFMPLIFSSASILSRNKILFAVPIINFSLSFFLLLYDYRKNYGKTKSDIKDMNFYLEESKDKDISDKEISDKENSRYFSVKNIDSKVEINEPLSDENYDNKYVENIKNEADHYENEEITSVEQQNNDALNSQDDFTYYIEDDDK